MSIAIDILQRELADAEQRVLAANGLLKEVQIDFRRIKHNNDLAKIRVAELQAALITLGATPDVKNA